MVKCKRSGKDLQLYDNGVNAVRIALDGRETKLSTL